MILTLLIGTGTFNSWFLLHSSGWDIWLSAGWWRIGGEQLALWVALRLILSAVL
jgi:hypothetical protein